MLCDEFMVHWVPDKMLLGLFSVCLAAVFLFSMNFNALLGFWSGLDDS